MKNQTIIFLIAISLICNNYSNIEKLKLSDYRFNNYSQFGEDGIIQKIFEIIVPTSKLCLEMGAHDGLFLSNTANLWKHNKWKAILIEGDDTKYKTLIQNISGYDCISVNKYIGKDSNNSLDYIVTDYLGIKDTIDLISIDIDGNDYYIFESLKIKPKIIICEYNPTIPHYLDIYQEYSDNTWEFGCSIAALNRIAKNKGYKLIALTDVNCFFVDEKYYNKFNEFETNVNDILIYDYLKMLITSYNGHPLIAGLNNNFIYPLKSKGYLKKLHTQNSIIRINNIETFE